MSADLEGMTKLKLKILECEDIDARAVLIQKFERLKTWEHPRVTAKMAELRMRNLIH
jgi:hypothetical protein